MKTQRQFRKDYDIQRTIHDILNLSLKNIALKKILQQSLDRILSFFRLASPRAGSISLPQEGLEIFKIKTRGGNAQEYNKAPLGDLQKTYSVPIKFSGNIKGNLEVYTKKNYYRKKKERFFLEAVSDTLAEIIQRRKTQTALERSNLALKVFSRCKRAIVKAKSEYELMEKICRIIKETGGYEIVLIGSSQEKGTDAKIIAQAGHSSDYINKILISRDKKRGEPAKTIMSAKKININRHSSKEYCLSPQDPAQKKRFASSISLPLKFNSFLGELTIYAKDPDAFDESEVSLLKELVRDLSFGLESIRLRKINEKIQAEKEQVERHLLESYKHLGSVNRQISILLDLYARSKGKNSGEIMEYILKSAANLSRAQVVEIFRYEKSTRRLLRISSKNNLTQKHLKEDILSTKRHSFLRPLIEKKNRVQGLFSQKTKMNFLRPRDKIAYFLFLPISYGKKLRGAIFFGFSGRHSITTQELDFLGAFSAQASLVLQNLDIFKNKNKRKK